MVNPLAALKVAEKKFNWHKHILRDDLGMRWAWSRGRRPVVVYSIPKTGSAAVYRALRKARGVFALKSHTLMPEHWRAARTDPAWEPGWAGMWRDHWHSDGLINRVMLRPQRPGRFISFVRDPIATNISSFVYFHHYWLGQGSSLSGVQAMSAADLFESFLQRYPHHVTTDWFDLEPRRALGIDVYQHPFSHERMSSVVSAGSNEMLVMRTEMDDEAKSARINEFVGVTGVRVTRFNQSHQGWGEVRRRLHEGIASHPSYVDDMLGHRFTRHFWTEDEREAMRSRWSNPPS